MAPELFAAAFAAGIVVKLVDQIEDDGLKLKNTALLFGLFYGFLLAYVMIKSSLAANLWMAAVLANVLAGKIDAPGHRLGVFSMLFILSIIGFPKFDASLLALFALAAYADEFLEGLGERKKIKNKSLSKIARLRAVLEITAFAVSVYTGQWTLFALILLFDAGYIAASVRAGKY